MPILPACSGEAALALAFPACPLPQRAIFLSFSSVFSLFVLFCFLLLWFTPHRTWMNSVSVILYVCSLDAFLWNYFPLIGHCNQQQRSVRACMRATPSNEGQATSTFPTPPASSPSAPHTAVAPVWGQERDFQVLKPGRQVWK